MKPRIRVFTNRIEFENPGTLPRPIAELMKEDISVPRNPVLAKLFRIAKLCESAGYGFDKMLAWKQETHQDVLFETFVDRTKVTFMLKDGKLNLLGGMKQPEKQSDSNQKSGQETMANSENLTENKAESAQKTTRKRTKNNQKSARKTTRKRTETTRNLIANLLKSNPTISRANIVKQLNISEGSLRHHLEGMKHDGILKREGADKGGKWLILNH